GLTDRARPSTVVSGPDWSVVRRFVASLMPAALVLVAACASGKSSIDVVTGAPAKTTAANTAKISEVIEITPASGQAAATGAAGKVTGEGAIDFANHRAELTVHVGDQSIETVLD